MQSTKSRASFLSDSTIILSYIGEEHLQVQFFINRPSNSLKILCQRFSFEVFTLIFHKKKSQSNTKVPNIIKQNSRYFERKKKIQRSSKDACDVFSNSDGIMQVGMGVLSLTQ